MTTNATRVRAVDLDGTLVATDLLWESLFSVLRTRPWMLLMAPLWVLRGRAYVKRRLARAAQVDFATLPYPTSVLKYIGTEHHRGRQVVLATAADESLAIGVSDHLGIFCTVLASDGMVNLKGRTKAQSLVHKYGCGNFDYIGDSRADIPCWQQAATPITANPSWRPRVRDLTTIASSERQMAHTLRSVVRAARPHQWMKNLLLLVPAIAAHRFDWAVQRDLALALTSFSLCASGGYVLNDLLDLAADRQHARKKSRPFAAGDLSLKAGIVMVLGLWMVGFGVAAAWLPHAFLGAIAVYLAATAAYSIRLKREPVLDVMFLAGLYVMRVVAGGTATNVPVSTWLLAFTLFVCLSLAFLKRFIEVHAPSNGAASPVPGRGYYTDDAAWLHSVGMTCAFLSAVVLAIYANNADVTRLYSHPERLLLLCPVLLYWATRIWLNAYRRLMHDDPVVAVAKDPTTYVIALISAGVVFFAV